MSKKDAITLPDIDFEDVSDYYTLYVEIIGISEDVFWNRDIAFVKTVAANKQAFDKWLRRQQEISNGSKKRSKN